MESTNESNIHSISLENAIQQVSHRLDTVSLNELSFIKNLEDWQNEAHEIIDKYCQLKRDEYLKRTKEEIVELKETIDLFRIDHDASQDYIQWIEQTIQSIHQHIDHLEQIQSKFSPLKLDQSLIDLPSQIIDSTVTTDENYQCISLKMPTDHWYSFATNEKHLLISGKSDLFLVDHSFKILNKKSFFQTGLKDICWSESLSRFILIFPKEIFLVNEQNLSFELTSIVLTNHNPWERGTTNETNLFLSTFGEDPFIVEFHLFPSIHFNKRYQSSTFSNQNEIINDMKSNELSLSLIIENSLSNQTRLDIRSIKSFDLISSIDVGQGWGYRCSSLNDHHWIVTDYYNQRLIFINNQAKIYRIENCLIKPYNVVYVAENHFVIRTDQSIERWS